MAVTLDEVLDTAVVGTARALTRVALAMELALEREGVANGRLLGFAKRYY